MRSLAAAVVLTFVSLAAAARTRKAPTVAAITPADLEIRLTALAHDSLMGRETGSEGNFKAAEYTATEFKRIGLKLPATMGHTSKPSRSGGSRSIRSRASPLAALRWR